MRFSDEFPEGISKRKRIAFIMTREVNENSGSCRRDLFLWPHIIGFLIWSEKGPHSWTVFQERSRKQPNSTKWCES